MKKNIVFALAALSLVATVRGATVDWTSGDLDVSAIQPISSVTAYYYVVSGSSAAETAANLYADGWSSSDLIDASSSGWSLKNPFSDLTELTHVTDNNGSDGWNVDYTQTSVSADEYVIVVYEAASEFGGKYAVATIGYYDAQESGDYIGDEGANSYTGGLGSDAIAYEASQSGGSGWAAVPEPTTVALLALGLAAVGLKRKVA